MAIQLGHTHRLILHQYFPPQSSNCSSNGGNVLTQSHNEYLDTQAEAWILDRNINDYDDNHSQPSLGDGSTHCCDSGCEHGYHPDPMLSDPLHGALDNPLGQPPVSQENLPTEAGLHETMAEEQQFPFPASQPMESQVVVTKELEVQAAQVTPANKQMQLHSVAWSKGELQEVHGPPCSPTQACQGELAAVTDIPTLQGCSIHA